MINRNFKDTTSTQVLVTVVTPVYNQASTLSETIESVLAQTYENIEYIIINDGSTDNTDVLLKEYQDSVRVITQENLGQAAALNQAWSVASGDYLTYLSADDIMYENCIESLVEAIDGENVVYYPDFDLIDSRSFKIRTSRMPDYSYKGLVCDLICQPGLAVLFRADAFKKIGGWDPSYRFIPDFEFWTRMATLGSFKRVPEILGGFRVHEESGSIRNISEVASDEIVRFVDEFSGFSSPDCRETALLQARFMSARSHFQSRRISKGALRYLQAFISNPIVAMKLKNIRFVLSGLFRRLYYRVKTTVSKYR